MEKDITKNKMSHQTTAEDGQPEVEKAEAYTPSVPRDMNAWLEFESRYCTTPPPGPEEWECEPKSVLTATPTSEDSACHATPAFDTDQAKRHLQALFHSMPSDHYFVVFCLPSRKSRAYRNITEALGDPWLAQRVAEEDVYVSMGTRRKQPMGWARGNSDGVDSICCLWCELDARGSKQNEEHDSALTVEDCEQIAGRLQPPPSFLVRSGHGVHSYWLLEAPLAITDENREEVTTVLQRFQKSHIARQLEAGNRPDSVFDLARVMRLAGTVNRKRPEALERVMMLNTEPYVTYSWETLRNLTTASVERNMPSSVPNSKDCPCGVASLREGVVIPERFDLTAQKLRNELEWLTRASRKVDDAMHNIPPDCHIHDMVIALAYMGRNRKGSDPYDEHNMAITQHAAELAALHRQIHGKRLEKIMRTDYFNLMMGKIWARMADEDRREELALDPIADSRERTLKNLSELLEIPVLSVVKTGSDTRVTEFVINVDSPQNKGRVSIGSGGDLRKFDSAAAAFVDCANHDLPPTLRRSWPGIVRGLLSVTEFQEAAGPDDMLLEQLRAYLNEGKNVATGPQRIFSAARAQRPYAHQKNSSGGLCVCITLLDLQRWINKRLKPERIDLPRLQSFLIGHGFKHKQRDQLKDENGRVNSFSGLSIALVEDLRHAGLELEIEG